MAVLNRTWSVFVPLKTPSLNDHKQNAGGGGWKYRRDRDAWVVALSEAAFGVPAARGPRRVVMTRMYTGRERERDYGNLVGGMKVVVDAMVRAGILLDDTPALLDDWYLQEKHPTYRGLKVAVTDLRPT